MINCYTAGFDAASEDEDVETAWEIFSQDNMIASENEDARRDFFDGFAEGQRIVQDNG